MSPNRKHFGLVARIERLLGENVCGNPWLGKSLPREFYERYGWVCFVSCGSKTSAKGFWAQRALGRSSFGAGGRRAIGGGEAPHLLEWFLGPPGPPNPKKTHAGYGLISHNLVDHGTSRRGVGPEPGRLSEPCKKYIKNIFNFVIPSPPSIHPTPPPPGFVGPIPARILGGHFLISL